MRPQGTSLVLVGRAGAGKSSLGRALSATTGRPRIELGHFVRRAAKRGGTSPLREAQRTFAAGQELRFARLAVAEAERLGLPCIIGGPRRPAELAYLRSSLAPVLAVALTLPEPERLARLHMRAPNACDDPNADRDEVEESWGLSETVADCDACVSTAGSLPSALAELLELWRANDERAGNSI